MPWISMLTTLAADAESSVQYLTARLLTLLVSVRSSANGGSKSPDKTLYEYLGAYSALSVWLDDSSDFVDTSFSAASQQIAAQIVSDLTQR